MKIKTIAYKLNTAGLASFDDEVNEALAEGWRLAKRDVLPGVCLGERDYFGPHLYAELVQLDPEPKSEETDDPIEALRTVQRVCLAVSGDDCGTDRCPLRKFCDRLRDGGDPTDWDLSEEAFT